MGSYLSSYLGSYLSRYLSMANTTLRPPARALRPSAPARRFPQSRPVLRQRGREQIRDPCAHPKRCVRTQTLPTIPPGQDYARVWRERMPKAWRRFPSQPPSPTPLGLDISGTPKSMLKRQLWNAHHPRRIQSLVTIKIAPPERRGSPYTGPPTQERPDPCAKETVLKALSQCKKGRRKFDGPLWFETVDKRRRLSPEGRRSAFKPIVRNGVSLPLVPRPGPLLLVQQCREEDPVATPPEPSLSAGTPPAQAAQAQAQPQPENLEPQVTTVSY